MASAAEPDSMRIQLAGTSRVYSSRGHRPRPSSTHAPVALKVLPSAIGASENEKYEYGEGQRSPDIRTQNE